MAIGLNLGYDPNTNKFGIQWFSGTIVNSIARENHALQVQYTDGLKSQTTTQTSVDGKVKFKSSTGRVMNGYIVSLAQAGLKGEQIAKIYGDQKKQQTNQAEVKEQKKQQVKQNTEEQKQQVKVVQQKKEEVKVEQTKVQQKKQEAK